MKWERLTCIETHIKDRQQTHHWTTSKLYICAGDARKQSENQNPGKTGEYAASLNVFFNLNNAQVAKSGNFSGLGCFNLCIRNLIVTKQYS